jgi:hypothetical protein
MQLVVAWLPDPPAPDLLELVSFEPVPPEVLVLLGGGLPP